MTLFSNIARLSALDLVERRVFLRADLNAALSSFGGVVDDTPLRAALPTLRHLLRLRAKVVLGAHYGEPSRVAPQNAAACVARRLAELLGHDVSLLSPSFAGEIALLENGEVALTPNLLELPEELSNDPAFAQRLARSLDAYVGDDVAAAAHGWATVDALPRCLVSRGAGLVLERELDMLELLADPAGQRPFAAVVGGDSFARKSRLLWSLLLRTDAMLLGGVVANTCLVASGWQPGVSTYEPDQLDAARAFLTAARAQGIAVHLPSDVLVLRPELGMSSLELRQIDAVRADEAVVDIGLDTCLAYREVLCMAVRVVWTGLMGVSTEHDLCSGTFRIAQAATSSAQHTAVFGRRTVELADRLDVLKRFGYVSRGRAGSLSLMSGTVLPGIESLRSAS